MKSQVIPAVVPELQLLPSGQQPSGRRNKTGRSSRPAYLSTNHYPLATTQSCTPSINARSLRERDG